MTKGILFCNVASKTFISEEQINENIEVVLEYDADYFAIETLIPTSKYNELKCYDENSIKMFSKSINIHPGIVVGRLQKEGKNLILS